MLAPIVSQILNWAIAVIFLIGAIFNLIAPRSLKADYARWGYPGWFHHVTAVLEAIVVVLLVLPGGTLAGIGLAALVMLAAVGTTLLHREYTRAIPPAIVLALIGTLVWDAWLFGRS